MYKTYRFVHVSKTIGVASQGLPGNVGKPIVCGVVQNCVEPCIRVEGQNSGVYNVIWFNSHKPIDS